MSVRKLGFALLLGLCFSVYASASCSNATLLGNYGFTISGVDATGQLAASVGQLIADGTGNFTGTFTNSTAGVISSNVTLTGTYSVKTGCTGTATITPSGGAATNFSLVVVSSGGQFELTETKAGSSQYGYALAQGKRLAPTPESRTLLDSAVAGTPRRWRLMPGPVRSSLTVWEASLEANGPALAGRLSTFH